MTPRILRFRSLRAVCRAASRGRGGFAGEGSANSRQQPIYPAFASGIDSGSFAAGAVFIFRPRSGATNCFPVGSRTRDIALLPPFSKLCRGLSVVIDWLESVDGCDHHTRRLALLNRANNGVGKDCSCAVPTGGIKTADRANELWWARR